MKKRPVIKMKPVAPAKKPVAAPARICEAAPVILDERPGNNDIAVTRVSTKTFLVPRMVCPRWSGVVDEFGGKFSGGLSLGNGTHMKIACFFDANRHFIFAILGATSWLFPAGQRTDWQAVQKNLSLASDSDAKCLSDFINSQLDDGLDENEHVGEYQRQFCS